MIPTDPTHGTGRLPVKLRQHLILFAGFATLPVHAATDTWEGSGPFATGAGNRVIHALAAGPDGLTIFAGTGSGTVFRYVHSNSVPTPFGFSAQAGVVPGTEAVSDEIAVQGINVPAPISIASCTGTACAYSINDGAWSGGPGMVAVDDRVRVRQTASASHATQTVLTLEIGGVSGAFSVTTAPAPVFEHGACGGAHAIPSLTAPLSGLCAVGTAGAVTSTASAYSWTCAGSLGGDNAACAAPRQYEVTPSAGANGAIAPAATQAVTHGQTIGFTVTPDSGFGIASITGCGGTLTGNLYTTSAITGACAVHATFTAAPVAGQCGTAHGQASLLAPTTGLCAIGTPGAVTSAAGRHDWLCQGANNGGDQTCAAPGASAHGGGGTITLQLTGGGCVIDSATPVAPPLGGPTGVTMPLDALGLTLTGCGTGGSAQVTVTYSTPVDRMRYWKYLNGAWTAIPATLSGDSAVFTLIDGGALDADGQANGVIVDPGGPGLDDAMPIPALAPWALALLAGLLGLLGLGASARRGRG